MTDRAFLALDLSTPRGNLAVVRGDEVLFDESFQSERSHNAQAFAPLRRALAAVGGRPLAVVVGLGPGSYTGVRIAIAIAQGLALSLGATVIGWPSITAPGQGLANYRVIGDARRAAYYVAELADGGLHGGIELVTAVEAQARLEQTVDLPWLSFDSKAPFQSSRVQCACPSAVRLAQLAQALPEAELLEKAATVLEPLYLQEAFITVARKPGKQIPHS
jgi:tRNA threonylcarbamoyl adenosine modification protein YeaZ